MAGSLGELFIELAFEGDTKGAEEFKKKINEAAEAMQKAADKAIKNAKAQKKDKNATQDNNKEKKKQKNNFKSAAKALSGYAAAISASIFAVKKLTDSLIEQNQTWLNLTRTSDIALSTYQKWNTVGKMYGINDAAQQIKNLNDRLFELKLTGANAQGFILAGINPTNADDVMEQLRARVAGLSDTSAAYLLRQMGLDENMLHILRLSQSEFNALNAEMKRFQLTDEQRKDIQQMNVQLQIASQKLQYLKDRAILAIMPHWVRFMENMEFGAEQIAKLIKWFSKLDGKFKALIIGITTGLTKFKPIAKLFSGFSGTLSKLITKIPIFGRLLGGLGGIISRAFLPLTILYYLLDDFRAFTSGGGSLIGVVLKAMHEFQEKGFFSDDVPKWLQMLARAADQLDRLFETDTSGMHDALPLDTVPIDENTLNDLKELQKTITDPKRKQAIEYLLQIEAAKKSPFAVQRNEELTRLTNRYLERQNNYTNNKSINIQQYNTIKTTEAAKDVFSILLPYTGQLQFANYNFTGQAI